MTISERARPVREMAEHERPISEEFRLVARAWVEAEKAASILEECKTATLSKMMLKEGDIAANKAEMRVKGSDAWFEYLNQMVAARSEANLRRVQMKFVEMKFSEWQSADANARRERQMGRQAT